MDKLKIGDKVKCEDKIGTVLFPGPYGDQSFQVCVKPNSYYPIWSNGKQLNSDSVWVKYE